MNMPVWRMFTYIISNLSRTIQNVILLFLSVMIIENTVLFNLDLFVDISKEVIIDA